MEKVNIENFKFEYPFEHNYELINNKGLLNLSVGEPSLEYFVFYNKYKEMFSHYLVKQTSMDIIENGFQESVFNFSPVKEENMDFYQKTDYLGFDYLYLRNNFYIENMSKSDIDYLRNCKMDDYKFIEKTFRNVIDKYPKKENVKTLVLYGPDNRKYLCNSEDIVIGIRYDDFKDNGLQDHEWLKNYLNQQNFIIQISNIVELSFNTKMNNPVRVILYNDVSASYTHCSQNTSF